MQQGPNQPQGGFDPFFQQQSQPQWQQPVPPQPGMPNNGQWPQQPQPGYPPQWPQQPMMPNQQPQWQQPNFQGQWQQVPPEMMQQQSQFDAYMQQMPQMPTAQQPMEQPAQPRKKRRRRKTGGGNGGWWKALIAVALVAGVALFFLKDFIGKPKLNTAVVENGTLGDEYVGDALIVRNEVAYDDESVQNIEFAAQEGSLVTRGDVICFVYSTGYSSKEMTTLQDYRDQIKEYQLTLLKSETAYDQKMTRLESEVLQRGLEVRRLVQGSRGNLLAQEEYLDAAITQRQNYFRSKYSSDTRLNRLYDDEMTQQQRIDSWIKQKIAAQDSIVSFYTDGFEYALTPSEYEKYTPAEVRAMINGQRPATSTAQRGRTDLYRLVKPNNYAVLMLVEDEMWNPVEGTTLKLVLEQFTDTVVQAKVLSFTRSGGELLVRLAVVGDVSDVLYLRTCRASLGEHVDCLKVPQRALYEKNGQTGVVLVTQEEQVFVPVKLLRQEGGYAYISPVQTGTLVTGRTVRLF
ncbi:MAG: hypothetical protein IKK75_04045 [Clostridia bacterium]|nr:hypothetical protein [Clostridia bacterium]